MIVRCSILLLATALSVTAAPTQSPQLKPDEVTHLARAAAQASGYKLIDYTESKPRFEVAHFEYTWTVIFEGKVLAPGNHFLVWDDDRTRKTKVMPGD